MRSLLALVLEPFGDRFTSLAETIKPVGVQALVAFDEGVLGGSKRAEKVESNTVAVRPPVEGIRYELGPVDTGTAILRASLAPGERRLKGMALELDSGATERLGQYIERLGGN